ncbi:MAG: heme-binding domain-containing protein [Chloroflexota bacterium]
MKANSWLIQQDVEEGRAELNFSEWDRPQEEVDEAAETVAEGEMPPRYYIPIHPSAMLSRSERSDFVAGLQAKLGGQSERRKR